MPLWFSYDSIRFQAKKAVIEAPSEAYSMSEVGEALQAMRDRGVPVDTELLNELHVSRRGD